MSEAHFNLSVITRRLFIATNRPLFVLLLTFFPIRLTMACVSEDGLLNHSLFVMAFIVALIIALVLVFLVWIIKWIFFRSHAGYSVLLVTALLFSLLLGVFGTFVVPQFESLYISFGADIPSQTKMIFRFHQFLWVPWLLILAIWLGLKNYPNRNYYLAASLFVETNLLALALWALYSGIFIMGAACGDVSFF